VSVDISNLCWNCPNKDTLSIVSNSNGETIPSDIWEQQSDGNWYQYGSAGSWSLNASLYIHPFLTDELSVATFTQSADTLCSGNILTLDATGSTYQDTLLWYSPGGTPSTIPDSVITNMTFNTAGTYEVTLYTIGGGCNLFSSLTSLITVKASPAVTTDFADSAICAGNTVNITASGADEYSWIPSAYLNITTGSTVSSTPVDNIIYKVTGTKDGCSDSSFVTFNVTQLVTPFVTLSSSDTVITNGENVVFTADGINGGAGAIYTFKLNDSVVQESSANTWSSTSLIAGDKITCTLISSLACVTQRTVQSDTITISEDVLASSLSAF